MTFNLNKPEKYKNTIIQEWKENHSSVYKHWVSKREWITNFEIILENSCTYITQSSSSLICALQWFIPKLLERLSFPNKVKIQFAKNHLLHTVMWAAVARLSYTGTESCHWSKETLLHWLYLQQVLIKTAVYWVVHCLYFFLLDIQQCD